jgi:hypothetical protein
VNKMYSVIPENGTGDFAVSRNGTATYFDKDGLLKTALANVPRFEFDPLTGDFKGVLVEPSATNLCTNSDPSTLPTTRWNVSFATNDWGIGLNNKIIFDNVGGTVDIFIGNNLGGSQPMGRANNANNHRISFFSKRVDGQKPIVYPSTEGFITGDAILADPTVDVFFYNGIFANNSRHFNRIEIPLTNNVWYFEYTFSSTGNPSDRTIIFRKGENNSTNIVEISGINVIELSESPSSYIPTTGSQVTRPADIISLSNQSSLFGQSEGSIFFEFQTQLVTSLSISGLNFYTPSENSKVVFTYSTTEKKLYQDGILVDSSTGSFSYGTLDTLFLGSDLSGSGQFQNLNIKQYSTYNYVLSEEDSIKLTL